MKIIAIAAVTAGGKTTVVDELKKKLSNSKALYFDDYEFKGAVEDYYEWVINGADYNVWNLEPLKDDVVKIIKNEECDYLLLDYPFAYCHNLLSEYIDIAVFIDTPLDIAMARRILRDMDKATGNEICEEMENYLNYSRVAYIQMLKDILPSSDYVVDGSKILEEITEDILAYLK